MEHYHKSASGMPYVCGCGYPNGTGARDANALRRPRQTVGGEVLPSIAQSVMRGDLHRAATVPCEAVNTCDGCGVGYDDTIALWTYDGVRGSVGLCHLCDQEMGQWEKLNQEQETDDDDDMSSNGQDEYAENYPVVTLDGDQVTQTDGRSVSPDDELERVQVSFPDKENGYQTEAGAAAPLGWCNSAAVTLDRGEDSVTVSISCGDPRGAFAFTVRRLRDGRLVMHVPCPEDTVLHRPLRQVRPGTFDIE